ncbi:MAG: ABC transporter transmembrane domain-containing protein, partial [Marmoricola sp.]
MSSMSPMMAAMRAMRTDPSVVDQKLTRRTVRRVVAFARPHRRRIGAFLVFVVLDAALVVATPLLVKHLLDDGILAHDGSVVTVVALAMVAVALMDAFLGVAGGYLSSRIGENLIYDLRTQVFGHVQRMSLAFFTRTQTGALVSRLNNDVIGAQRAFTSTLSSTVANTISVVVVGVEMIALSWQITLLSLVLLPVFIVPARLLGTRLQALTREAYGLNAQMNTVMTERF